MQADGQTFLPDLDDQDDAEAKERYEAELQAAVAAEAEKLTALEKEADPAITKLKDDLAAVSTDAFNERMSAISAQIAIETAKKRRNRSGPIGTGKRLDPKKAKRRQIRNSRRGNR